MLPWGIVYYQAPDGTAPALEFLDTRLAAAELNGIPVSHVSGHHPPRM
jgi:hypothetical protein